MLLDITIYPAFHKVSSLSLQSEEEIKQREVLELC
ncbi:hypothetical protein Bra60_003460 [Bartonella sp. Raccoon60]|nr:hypothetical protein Bra60_003460 [Bartonella sp. Raccoon60]